jgi:NADH-quinone oxidoreductase subunit N
MLGQDLSVVAPELVLVVFAMAALMWGVYSQGRDPSRTVLWLSTVLLVLCGLWVGFAPEGTRTAFGGAVIDDGVARFA